jgi:hypothetical protein
VFAWFEPRLLNLEGMAGATYQQSALQHFLKYHQEFRLSHKIMGDYHSNDEED